MSDPRAVLAYGVVLTGESVDGLPWRDKGFDAWWLELCCAMAGLETPLNGIVPDCPIVFQELDDERVLIAVPGSVTDTDWDTNKEPAMAVSEKATQLTMIFCIAEGIPFDDAKWLLIAYSVV